MTAASQSQRPHTTSITRQLYTNQYKHNVTTRETARSVQRSQTDRPSSGPSVRSSERRSRGASQPRRRVERAPSVHRPCPAGRSPNINTIYCQRRTLTNLHHVTT